MDGEIIEADFQQYYNLDLREVLRNDFRRYARLLVNLPADCRIFRKYNPIGDWNWDKEMQSQILMALDRLRVDFYNANRGKKQKRAKPMDQMQPDYVKEGKKEIARQQLKAKQVGMKKKKQLLHDFYQQRNPDVKMVGDLDNE